ncbi:MAG: hypothetical protein R3E79_55910 [Caldilineaceae bacterium]
MPLTVTSAGGIAAAITPAENGCSACWSFVPLVVIATALVSAFWYLLRMADPTPTRSFSLG